MRGESPFLKRFKIIHNCHFEFDFDRTVKRMSDMTEKAAVATFLIAAFQSEGQTAFLAGLSAVMFALVSLVLTNLRVIK